MNLFHAPIFALRLGLAGVAAAAVLAPLAAQAQAPGLDQQDLEKAGALADAGNYQEAADLYAGIQKNYPTSPLIPQATLRLGYVYFRLADYDKAAETLAAVGGLKNVTPEATELAMSLIPQVHSAKAATMKADAPARKTAFEDAVKQFDAFLQKYPTSTEVEAANYGKAVALYQLARYEEAIATLTGNVTKFQKSDTVLDSQYLLALTMGTLANVTAQKATAPDPANDTRYENAEKLLNDIINKRSDVALANDSRFQIGEILYVRAGFIPPKEEATRKAMYRRALEAYRLVAPKDLIIQAQKVRIEAIKAARQQALLARDLEKKKRIDRFLDREQEKLANLEARPDQTLTARLKGGQIFFHLGAMDEARVVLNYAKAFVEEEDQKKEIVYYTALSLASQNTNAKGAVKALSDRTEAAYQEFVGSYKGDPIAENLAVVVGVGYVESDPPKSIKYFEESAKDYPKGHFKVLALTQQASALLRLEKYDEALKAFQETLAQKPEKEVAAAAEYGVATVYQKTQKIPEALTQFKKVRDEYAGLSEAENAAFWYGQLLGESGKPAEAVPELQAFVKNFPKSEMMPNALYYLAQSQSQIGKKDDAIATYKKLGTDFPKSEVAPFSYLQRGNLLMGDQKFDEVIATMHELIKAYPDGKQLFQAYDLIAQIHSSQQKIPEAIATYEEFVKSKPEDENSAQALSRVAPMWMAEANKLGRYVALNPEQQEAWKKDLDASIDAAVRLVTKYPESPQVALGLKTLLDVQKMRQSAKLITPEDVQKYFADLAEKFKDKPSTRSKIIFTQAANIFEKDKAKAIELMSGAYDESLKYSPADLDLYGTALIEQQKYDEAKKVYDKLAKDYPLPPNAAAEPGKINAPQEIQEAQAMVLFGQGKILQEQKKEEEAGKLFADLEKLYGWSPKMLEANYGIALSLYQQKKYEDTLKRLVGIVKASTASPELRAKGMFLLARVHEDQGNFETAIDNYIKIGKMFSGVPTVAAEGLWRGANLLERQGKGEIPMPTPPPKAAKPAAAAKPGAAPAKH